MPSHILPVAQSEPGNERVCLVLRPSRARWRPVSRRRRPFLVRLAAHAEMHFAPGDNLRMRQPGTSPLFAVQLGALDIDVFRRIVLGNDGECLCRFPGLRMAAADSRSGCRSHIRPWPHSPDRTRAPQRQTSSPSCPQSSLPGIPAGVLLYSPATLRTQYCVFHAAPAKG